MNALVIVALLVLAFVNESPRKHYPYWCRIEACATDGRTTACRTEADHCSAFKAITKDI